MKGLLLAIFVLVLILVVGSGAYFMISQNKITEEPTKDVREEKAEKKPIEKQSRAIFTYTDSNAGQICSTRSPVSNTRIKVVYFIPSDKQGEIVKNWKGAMTDVFSQIEAFFEKEFKGNINIKSEIYPSLIIGKLSTQKYDEMGPYYTLVEIKKIIAEENPDFLKSDSSEFTSWMAYSYLNNGGAGCEYAFNSASWLEPKYLGEKHPIFGYTDDTGYINSAHEFSHTLGIPHPPDMAANVDNSPDFGCSFRNGSLMCHGGVAQLPFTSAWLREDVKEIMGR